MKKILVMLVVIACISGSACAQFSGGFKGGINFYNVKQSGGSNSETHSGTSFHVGAYNNFALGKSFSIQPELLLYNALGVNKDKMEYLSIPVMLQYGFADNKFNVQAGPQLGFLLSDHPDDMGTETFQRKDISFNLGVGANFGKFNASIRYCIGLINILKDSSADYEVKTANFQVSVGYKLFGN